MQKVVSSEPRAEQIVDDILLDMETKPRLMDGRGNAMLVGVEHLPGLQVLRAVLPGRLQGQVRHRHQLRAAAGDIAKEDSGEGATEKLRQYEIYRQMLADHFDEPADEAMSKVEQFEKEVKERFVNEPGQMRLLIVVDKLLTGFDAPSATYLYIDKKMQRPRPVPGHLPRQPPRRRRQGLRLHRRLPRPVQLARDGDHRLHHRRARRLRQGGHRGSARRPHRARPARTSTRPWSGSARSASRSSRRRTRSSTSSTSAPPSTGNAEQLKANEPKRVELYKAVAALVARLRATSPTRWTAAGYTDAEAAAIKAEVAHYADVRDEVKLGAGEDVDFKQYEAGMRHLLDTYIQAEPSEVVADFEDAGLIELIVELGAGAIDKLPDGHQEGPRGGRRDDRQQHAQGDHRRARR